jgi:hypothetical protein
VLLQQRKQMRQAKRLGQEHVRPQRERPVEAFAAVGRLVHGEEVGGVAQEVAADRGRIGLDALQHLLHAIEAPRERVAQVLQRFRCFAGCR